MDKEVYPAVMQAEEERKEEEEDRTRTMNTTPDIVLPANAIPKAEDKIQQQEEEQEEQEEKEEGDLNMQQGDPQGPAQVQEKAQKTHAWALSDDMRYDALEEAGEGEEGVVLMDVDKQEEEPEPSSSFLEDIPNALSLAELIKRRKGKVSKLIELYREQYWLLADELCARAQRFQQAVASTSHSERHDDPDVKELASFAEYYKEKETSDQRSELVQGGSRRPSLPSFSDLERDAFSAKVRLEPRQTQKETKIRRRKLASERLSSILGLEKTALSVFSRRAKKKGALACLVGKRATFYLSRPEVSLGRNTKFQMVDIDLSEEGSCSKVSRQQGMIRMHSGGSFYFQNFGQRKVRVNHVVVPYKRRIVLQNGALLEVGGLRFMFLTNPLVNHHHHHHHNHNHNTR